jgi:hypothetical protein
MQNPFNKILMTDKVNKIDFFSCFIKSAQPEMAYTSTSYSLINKYLVRNIAIAALFVLLPTIVSAQFYMSEDAMVVGLNHLYVAETENTDCEEENNNIAVGRIYIPDSVMVANFSQLTHAEIIYLPESSNKTVNIVAARPTAKQQDLTESKEEEKKEITYQTFIFASNDGSTLLPANEKSSCIAPITPNARKLFAKNAELITDFGSESQLSLKLYTHTPNDGKTADYKYYFFSRPPPQIA